MDIFNRLRDNPGNPFFILRRVTLYSYQLVILPAFGMHALILFDYEHEHEHEHEKHVIVFTNT